MSELKGNLAAFDVANTVGPARLSRRPRQTCCQASEDRWPISVISWWGGRPLRQTSKASGTPFAARPSKSPSCREFEAYLAAQLLE